LFKYADLSDGHYSLGKAFVVSAHLAFYNALLILGLTHEVSILALLVLGGGFGSMALISGWYHAEFSQTFSIISSQNLYCRIEKKIKRFFDLSAATLGLVIISPLLALCFAMLTLESKGSPIFCQTRIGKKAIPFRMFKFRSMVRDADRLILEQKPILHKWHDDPRITPLGKVIRKLSVDELPQLWNVVIGEMSLVGPRPPLPSEYELMNAYHRRKFEATPGLTGLWQVIGRVENQRDFNSVALYDTMYIENWSLIEDIRILLKTIPVVLLQKGAS
jgi:lipopolysaccharide/colanic/teichoic acid biosynthesis glycosyltransferase